MTQPVALPYSPARTAGDLVFIAGQIGRDPNSGIAKPGIEEQTHQAMKNLVTALQSQSADLQDLVKTTVYLTDMSDYSKFNEIYASYLSEPYPARTCIAVKELPRVAADVDLVVEIEAIAQISK